MVEVDLNRDMPILFLIISHSFDIYTLWLEELFHVVS